MAMRWVRGDSARRMTSLPSPFVSRTVHSCIPARGLEEFFNTGSTAAGDSWTPDLLRKKSVEDLHKLWFVLLKERNMLHTRKHDCSKRKVPMDGEDRIKKVQKSMRYIKKVLGERERVAKEMVVDDLVKEHNLKTRAEAEEMLAMKKAKKYPHPYPSIPETSKYIH
eukprot:jgi/Bigna1/58792/fgenesh1_kg.1_\